jgi:predicted AAA+ superfamily ATPase
MSIDKPLLHDKHMFNRLIVNNLHEWKESSTRKPLVLRGARQVGKTVAVRMFGASYDHFTELNMEHPDDAALFERSLGAKEIIQAIKLRARIPATTDSWLLFVDEIQACPAAVSMLRYLYEETPDIHVISAGSLLEVALQREHISFPVGRVEFRYLAPMNFEEFLGAIAGDEMVKAFQRVPSPAYAEQELFTLYHKYALIGGMPEAVAAYARSEDIVAVNQSYESLFTAYLDDIPKYARNATMGRVLRHCLRSAPFNTSKRIRFAGFGDANYGSREVGEALRTLEQVMLISLLYPTVALAHPFVPNARKSPRLQWLDTGLLHYVTEVQQEMIGITDLAAEFRGGLLEQLTGQELLASDCMRRHTPRFWVRNKSQSQAEIDFLELHAGVPLPIEVKSGSAGKLRSLHLFMDSCPSAKIAVRLYRGPFMAQEAGQTRRYKLLNIPYYHAARIGEYVDLMS